MSTNLREHKFAMLDAVRQNCGALADACTRANAQEVKVHHVHGVNEGTLANLGTLYPYC